MSQKNLKIRGKFINKFISKVQVLDDGLELFSKVNKKIFQNNNNQKGGDNIDITELQLATIQKKKTLKDQQEKLELLKKTVESLSTKIKPINDAITQTTTEIQNMNIKIPEIVNAAPDIKVFSLSDLKIIETAMTNGTQWNTFNRDNALTMMIKKNQMTEALYKKYVPS